MYLDAVSTIAAVLLLIGISAIIDTTYALAFSVVFLIACIIFIIYWFFIGRHKHSDIPERFAKLTRWTRPYIFRLTYTRTRARQAAIRRLRPSGKYAELDLLPDGATGYVVYHDGVSVGCIPFKMAKFIKRHGGAKNFAVFVAGIGLNDGEHYAVDVYLTFDRKKRGS